MCEGKPNETQQAGWIVDARGKRVSQIDPVMMHLLHKPGTIPPDVLKKMAEGVGLNLTRGTRCLLWCSMLFFICLVIAVVICYSRLSDGNISRTRFFINLIPYFFSTFTLFFSWYSLRRARHRQIGKVMLRFRYCPHCGYDIHGLPLDAMKEYTVCPECGSAWNLPDVEEDVAGGKHDRQ